MIAYASRTGTKRNLRALRARGWRLLVSAKGVWRTEGFRYAIDNGAWWAYQNDQPFDEGAFEQCIAELGADADWIAVPDIVMGGLASLAFSRRWLRRLRRRKAWRRKALMLVVQDGMEPKHVRRLIGPKVGIFVGGSTDWKEATLKQWADLAREHGAISHGGRVNTARRVHLCEAAGIDSFDGSSASRYAVTAAMLDGARRQLSFETHLRRATC